MHGRPSDSDWLLFEFRTKGAFSLTFKLALTSIQCSCLVFWSAPDVSPVPVAAFCQYQGIVGAELTVAKPATTPKEDSGFGSEGSVCGGRRGSMVSPESGICLRTPAICQESSPNGHDATGPERYITSPNYSAIPESRHEEEDGEPMYESSYTYIVHQVTPGQK